MSKNLSRLLTLLYCACTNWWSQCPMPLPLCCFSQGFAEYNMGRKRNCCQRGFKYNPDTCVKPQVLILFADRLRRKKFADCLRKISTCRLTHLCNSLPCSSFFFPAHVLCSKASWKIHELLAVIRVSTSYFSNYYRRLTLFPCWWAKVCLDLSIPWMLYSCYHMRIHLLHHQVQHNYEVHSGQTLQSLAMHLKPIT